MVDTNKLLEGYKKFYQKYFIEDNPLYKELFLGQSPKTLVIACSDSRVDPSTVLNTKPGDIFVLRNVANLVPPYQDPDETQHGTSAAIEFAVFNLKVENIVVLGHGGCAGIKAAHDAERAGKNSKGSFVSTWVSLARNACRNEEGLEESLDSCEKNAIISSLENLRSFPWIKDKEDRGEIELHGWHFSIETGELTVLEQG
jgi:carbonic anhydrase